MILSLGYLLHLDIMHAINDVPPAMATHGSYSRLDQQALAVVVAPGFRGPYCSTQQCSIQEHLVWRHSIRGHSIQAHLTREHSTQEHSIHEHSTREHLTLEGLGL